jgi:iron(III) transport system ATP-binding protein
VKALQLQQLYMNFGDVPAVQDVNLEIGHGEFFSLLGPSGCGKTTTLRMVAGFLRPTSGKILFGDHDLTPLPPEKRDTGMVFQNYALFPHMTVFENVAFGLKARKLERTEIREKVARALTLVNLAGLESRPVPELSGGQQQRVALARALAVEPRFLLLDEPLSNLDAKLREETRAQLLELQRRLEVITIYVTHDQEEALELSSRIAVMFGGKIHQVGTPEEIYGRPADPLVANFVGRSQSVDGTVQSADGKSVIVHVGDTLMLRCAMPVDAGLAQKGRAVRVAFRPEAVQYVATMESQPNRFEARVKNRRFHGAYHQYTLAVDGIEIFSLALNNSEKPLEPGATGFFSIDPAQVFLFGE